MSLDPFATEPDYCPTSLAEYEVEDAVASTIITDFNSATRTFAFRYDSDLAPLDGDALLSFKDYRVTVRVSAGITTIITSEFSFALRVRNPCEKPSGLIPSSSL